MRFILSFIYFIATPAFGGVIEAVNLTKNLYQNFEIQTYYLEEAIMTDCTPETLIPAYHNAFDAWISASIIQFGPIEDNGGSLSIAFWPDKKGFTAKTLRRLIQDKDPAIKNEQQFSEVSIAGKGFFALEFLLFDPEFNTYSSGDISCSLVKAIVKDIAQKASTINALWQTNFANSVLSAGEPGNTIFLSKKEAAQSYLTTLIGTLKFIERSRLGRPLATLENPRPKRAEAWRSERPLRNIEMSLKAIEQLVIALGDGEVSLTEEEISIALRFLPSIKDNSFQSITETPVHFRIGSLLQMVSNIKEAATEELSLHLGVTTGFNALDGD